MPWVQKGNQFFFHKDLSIENFLSSNALLPQELHLFLVYLKVFFEEANNKMIIKNVFSLEI